MAHFRINVDKYCRARQDTADSTMRAEKVRYECWITKARMQTLIDIFIIVIITRHCIVLY